VDFVPRPLPGHRLWTPLGNSRPQTLCGFAPPIPNLLPPPMSKLSFPIDYPFTHTHHVHLMHTLRGFSPWNYVTAVRLSNYQMVQKSLKIVHSFTYNTTTWQTDRQTDRNGKTISRSACYRLLTPDNTKVNHCKQIAHQQSPRSNNTSICNRITHFTLPLRLCSECRGPRAGSGVVRIDPLRFLAGCRTRRLNQALSVLSLNLGFFWCTCCAVN